MSAHFTVNELVFSSTAHARGVNNMPPQGTLPALNVLAAGLEQVRAILSAPMHIDSGYRCPELNMIVRGVPTSAHVTGYAADFICDTFGSPLQIVRWLAVAPLQFDQLIQEGTWVHISFAPAMRREVLTAHFIKGKATYSAGV